MSENNLPPNNTAEKKKHKAGFVNIIGKPNAGKSTLMNAMVGEKLAIITSKAQTTRHRLMGIVNGDDFQIVYGDTPGIIEPKYKLQQSMMNYVKTSLKDADVLLILVDIRDNNIDAFWPKVEKLDTYKIFLLNKVDLVEEEEADSILNYWKIKTNCDLYLPISALYKTNLDKLFEVVIKQLPVHPPFYPKDEMTDRPMRFFISEIIREKILMNYHQEIPYSTEVEVEVYQEEAKLIRIRAIIYVARSSQKPIIIGSKGSKIKKVGIEARKDLEAFVEKQIYLELFVKVRENWRDDEKQLKRFGYDS